MRAAVLFETGGETLTLRDDITLAAPAPGQVRIRIRATGVCHSDLSAMTGVIPQPAPFVPGHEGAGEIVAVGDGVTQVAVGDHVVVCWNPPCDSCESCRRGEGNLCVNIFFGMTFQPHFRLDGTDIYGFAGSGTFAEEMVVPWQCAVKIPDDVPFDVAALIGCGVTTGVGAVLNTARVEPGSSVAVIGAGGVGISVIQGAGIAGAAEIVAIDPVESKHAAALRFGATRAVKPEDADAAKAEVTGKAGFDYVFEVVGRSALVRQAYALTRRGGTVTVVGAGKNDDLVTFDMFQLFFDNKRILGSYYGGADPRREYRRLIALWRAGRLDLEGMITARLKLDDINQALDLLRSGEAIRTIIEV
ncbi:Zn-dependent alcohol dehydrogenase [Catenulispora yoronensis]|uniref:Zn-dependent alcohol dehydrogenase n=1 Tax=Catenulispora yoronensis TaxID=450799 RepID=A0ABP5GPQ5_9ACTN